jgi:hypothetical protein
MKLSVGIVETIGRDLRQSITQLHASILEIGTDPRSANPGY